MKELSNQIVEWIKNYAITANRKSLVVGVSGGVDSALVSTLCAMTGLPTHCVILPCQSKENDTIQGCLHINWLGNKFGNFGNAIHSHRIDLTSTFESFQKEVKSRSRYGDNGLAYANAKSRLRMIALYHIATLFDGLVVGTGNKVEDFGVGFFTKYGDGGVDISPIADLYKSEVRGMAAALGILPEIVSATPKDGLWDDDRSDESQLGASYSELEWAMEYHRIHLNRFDSLTDREKEVLRIYDKWHKMTAHKLNPIPTFKRQ